MQNLENLKTTFNVFQKRTISEQVIGFFLFLSTILTLAMINNWIMKSFETLIWSLSPSLQNRAWSLSSFFMAISFWILWRQASFKELKLEASLLSSNLFLILFWHIFFFALHQPFLGLIINLILLGCAIICFYTFWRKDRLSGFFFSLYLFWVSIITSFNMLVCI